MTDFHRPFGTQHAPARDDALRQAFMVFDLPAHATMSQIRNRYRRLAKVYHPDRTGGDKAAEAQFIRLAKAYNVIKKAINDDGGSYYRTCTVCQQRGELFESLYGTACCADCLLGQTTRRRLLPAPMAIVVRHTGVVVLELAAVLLLWRGVTQGSLGALVTGLLVSLLAFGWLAVTAVRTGATT